MDKNSHIFVAGSRGLVGSAIVRKLQSENFTNLELTCRPELDLINQSSVDQFFKKQSIDYVFIAAARVGGIHANSTYPADFLYENLMIASNVIHASANQGVKKLLFLGSSCTYPKLAVQPISESSLLTGPLEPTNEAYAIAKIAGLKLCEMYQRQYKKCFISAMPTNLYGSKDNFHFENSHVIPGLLRRFHEAKVSGAKSVVVWGSGKPKREFLFVDDLADALDLLMKEYDSSETINVGSGKEVTIAELAEMIKSVVGYEGKISWDLSQPDGTPRKIVDSTRLKKMGWQPKTDLYDGLCKTYQWALENRAFPPSNSKNIGS